MNKTVSDWSGHPSRFGRPKPRGIAATENYFFSLPEASKNHFTYGGAHSSAAIARSSWLMMKDVDLGQTSMPYNSIMTLYCKTEQHDRISGIVQEMKSSHVMLDSFSYNVWMRAFVSLNDISKVEKMIDEMKRDGRAASDWTTYSNLALINVDRGMFDKVRRVQGFGEGERPKGPLRLSVFNNTMGKLGRLLEVYRIWRSLWPTFPKTANISYLNMIQVLVNLKDLLGVRRNVSRNGIPVALPTYDIHVANALIGTYAQRDELEKADERKERARRSGAKPNPKPWEILDSSHHLKKANVKSEIDCIVNVISISRGDGEKWIPPPETARTLMGHFEHARDVEGSERFVELLKNGGDNVGEDVFESLIVTITAAERKDSALRRRLKMEKFEVSNVSEKLLGEICVEGN